jgi:hypothetical protein
MATVASPPLRPYKREPHLAHFLHNSLLPLVSPLPTSCCPSSSSNPPLLRSIVVGHILITSLLLKLVVRIPACPSSCWSHAVEPPWPEPPRSVSFGKSQSPWWTVLHTRFTVFIDSAPGLSYWKTNPKFSKFWTICTEASMFCSNYKLALGYGFYSIFSPCFHILSKI